MPQITTTDEQNIPVWLINLTEAVNAEAQEWRYSFPEFSPKEIAEAVDRHCSERRRELLQTYYSDPSMSYEQLAELTGVTVAHVKSTMEMAIPFILWRLNDELELSDNIGEEIDENGRRILWKNVNGLYYVDIDGIIKKEAVSSAFGSFSDKDIRIARRFEAELAKHGYHPNSPVMTYPKLLESTLGMTWEELLAEVDLRVVNSGKKSENRKKLLGDDARRLDEMHTRFKGVVRCFEKSTLRVYNTGFTVKILLNTDDPKKMKKFIRENSKEFLSWVIESIESTNKIMKYIGDMDYYKPVGMTCLKGGEVEVFFEVKKQIEEDLDEA